MKKVYERLYTGDASDCFGGAEHWAVVHGCRYPCLRRAMRRLKVSSENPVHLEDGPNLYLDLFDGPARYFTMSPFKTFLAFAGRHWDGGAGLLIHCNQGKSRAPSLALLFLAKHSKALPSKSYDEAFAAFSELLPDCSPGEGIQWFLRKNWQRF